MPIQGNDASVQFPSPPLRLTGEADIELMERIRSRQAKIAVLGMGHVGLPTALSLAEMGWKVLGADNATPQIERLRSGYVPFYEPGLGELLEKHLGNNFVPVEDLESAIREATILFICVGTPQINRMVASRMADSRSSTGTKLLQPPFYLSAACRRR